MTVPESTIPMERIEGAIYRVRGHNVLLDEDLADLYAVSTRTLNQAVTRNSDRFPEDFAFRLTRDEWRILMSQTVTSRWGGRRKLPRAFTEQGVAMLSSVLRSPRAILVNIEVMRTFVRLRRLLASHEDLARKLDELEARYDQRFRAVFEAIRELMDDTKDRASRRIGFRSEG